MRAPDVIVPPLSPAFSNEEIFVDAFSSSASTMHPDANSLRSSRLYEEVHAFMNVAALCAILGFVATYRNKSLDLASWIVEEAHLKPAVETVVSQSMLLGAFCGSLILTLWNLEYLRDPTSVFIASECSIVILFCWFGNGYLLLKKA